MKRLRDTFLAVISIGLFIASASADPEQIRESFLIYQELFDQGNFKESLPYARQAYELAEQLPPEQSEAQANLTYYYGANLVVLKKYDEAEPILEQALQRYENVFGKDSERLIPVLMDLGYAGATYGDVRPQSRNYSRALKLAKKHWGKKSVEYGRLQLSAGKSIMERARTKHAKVYLAKAYRILNKELGPVDSETGQAAFYLAKAEMRRRDYWAARKHLLAVLDTFEDRDSPSNKFEMMAHAFLVETNEHLGNSDQATVHALAIGRMTPARGNQDYVPLYRQRPRYPDYAARLNISGSVDLRFTIDSQGYVQDIETLEVIGDPVFEGPAVRAAKKFRYAPSFVEGKAVATHGVLLRLNFVMND